MNEPKPVSQVIEELGYLQAEVGTLKRKVDSHGDGLAHASQSLADAQIAIEFEIEHLKTCLARETAVVK